MAINFSDYKTASNTWDQAINAAIDASAMSNPREPALGKVSDGPYDLFAPIILKSYAWVVCERDCYFRRQASPAGVSHLVVMCDDDTKNVYWYGGQFERQDITPAGETGPTYETGNVFDLEGDRITIEEVRVRNWSLGRAFAVTGDDIVLVNPDARYPVARLATAGVRFTGGRGFRCFGGYIESSDDTFVFAPGPVGTRNGDQDIEDCAFIGCRGNGARLINASLGASGTDGFSNGDWAHDDEGHYATASIRNVRFVGITGIANGKTGDEGNGRALKITNESSSGIIDGVEVSRCSVTCSSNIDAPVTMGNYAGGVRNIRFADVSILDGGDTSISPRLPVGVIRVEGFEWTSGRIAAPGTGGNPTIRLRGVTDMLLSNVSLGTTAGDTIVLEMAEAPDEDHNAFGIPSQICANVVIDHCTIPVAADHAGVRLTDAQASGVQYCYFSKNTAADLGDLTKAVVIADNVDTKRCFVNQCNVLALEADGGGTTRTIRRPIVAPAANGHATTLNKVAETENFDLAYDAVNGFTVGERGAVAAVSAGINPGAATVIKLAPTAASTINTLTPTPGRVITLVNTGTAALTIAENSGTPAASRFLLGGSRTLSPGAALRAWYDDSAARWRAAS